MTSTTAVLTLAATVTAAAPMIADTSFAGGPTSDAAAAADAGAPTRQSVRTLLVFAPDARSAAFTAQRDALQRGAAAMRDLDLVAVLVAPSAAGTSAVAPSSDVFRSVDASEQAALRRRYGVAPDAFAVILLGKDGGEKLRRNAPVDFAVLRDTIEAMPMRQRERREADRRMR